MSDYSFYTSDMILADNLVPSKYAGQDVRLLYSKSNPASLGFYLSSNSGHIKIGFKALIESITGHSYKINDPDNKEVAQLIRDLPVAYIKEE